MEVLLVSLLNGLVYGMLLFMLASGLTLIFSMMGDENVMRAEDHQWLGPLHEAIFTHSAKLDAEKTGLGWKTVTTVLAKDIEQPTICKMKRPTMK